MLQKKRLLGLLITVMMICSLLPAAALAAEYGEQGSGGNTVTMLSPNDITVLSEAGYYNNKINTPFYTNAAVDFGITMSAGMNNFNPDNFKDNNMPIINIYKAYGDANPVAAYNGGAGALKYRNYDKDNKTIYFGVDKGVLTEGSYALVIGKSLYGNDSKKSIGQDAVFAFTVETPSTVAVTGVKLNNTKLTLNAGKSAALKATVSPDGATNTNVTWKSGSSKVATVSSKGVVTAKGAGKATITVTTADGKYTAKCVVTVNVPAVKVTLDKTKASIAKGKSIRLTATVTPSNVSPSKITWTTSDAKVATVSSTGLVKGIKAGKATITAKAWNGKYTRCVVTVK